MLTSPRQALQDNVNFTLASTARQGQIHLGNHSQTRSNSPRQSQPDKVKFTSAITARQGQLHLGNHSQTRSTSPRQSQPDKVNFTSAITARQGQLHLGKHCKTMANTADDYCWIVFINIATTQQVWCWLGRCEQLWQWTTCIWTIFTGVQNETVSTAFRKPLW